MAQVVQAAQVIGQHLVQRIVVQGVDGEVAPVRIFIDISPGIVPQNDSLGG